MQACRLSVQIRDQHHQRHTPSSDHKIPPHKILTRVWVAPAPSFQVAPPFSCAKTPWGRAPVGPKPCSADWARAPDGSGHLRAVQPRERSEADRPCAPAGHGGLQLAPAMNDPRGNTHTHTDTARHQRGSRVALHHIDLSFVASAGLEREQTNCRPWQQMHKGTLRPWIFIKQRRKGDVLRKLAE